MELWDLSLKVEQATTVAEVEAVLDSIGKDPEKPAEKTELEKAKEEALAYLEALEATGQIDHMELWDLSLKIDQATTVAEVEAVLDSIGKGEEKPEEKTELEKAKEAALEYLAALEEAGHIDHYELWDLSLQIDQATSVEEVNAILDSIGKGEEKPEEKSELEIAKEKAQEYLKTLYEANQLDHFEYWELSLKVELATSVEEVEAILDSIGKGEEKPEENVVDLTVLAAAIENAKALEEADYTLDSWAFFAAALETAEDFVAAAENNTEITQEQVDTQVTLLNAAIAGLEKQGTAPGRALDVTELAETINSAKLLKEADYTKVTWGVFSKALTSAENFLASLAPNAEARAAGVEVTQADIDAETANLKAAMTQLALAKTDDGGEDDGKDDGKDEGKKDDKKDDKKADAKKDDKLPQTDEKSSGLAAIYGIFATALAGVFFTKKRRNNKENF